MATAQNLIPNPRFEQISDCQKASSLPAPIELAPPWFNPNGTRYNASYSLSAKVCVPVAQWVDAPFPSDGFIQTYATYQVESGNVISNKAAYASVPLTQPLQAGIYYWFSTRAIIALGTFNGIGSPEENSFGVLLSPDRPAFSDETMQPIANGRPQLIFTNRRTSERRAFSDGHTDDVAGRQVMQGCFQAQGNEQYITIGDFRHPNYSHRFSLLQFTDVRLNKMPDQIDLGPDTTFCAGDKRQLNAHFPFPATYRWQNGSTDSTLTVTKSGLYSLTVTCSCRSYTDSVRVTVRDVGLTVEPDTSVCADAPILLHALLQTPGTGPVRYQWLGGSSAATLSVARPDVYTVVVEQQNCTYRDSVRVQPSGECCEVNLPTAFSPNADGLNDVFSIITGCSDVIREPELLIYNRWGEVIFRTQDLVTGWNGHANGQLCTTGEYTWQLRYTLPIRRSVIRRQQRGVVLLIR